MRLDIDVTEDAAWALAELCKRFTYEDAVRRSVRHDGGFERDNMLAAVCALARALAKEGYAPR